MTASCARPTADDPWCDVDGVHLSLLCRVEQVAEDPEPSVLVSGLGQRGQVVGRSSHQLYVCFDGESQLIGVAPRLLRLLPDTLGGG